jgi:hypothetical protein
VIRALAFLSVVLGGCLREVDLTRGADAAPPDADVLEPDAQFAPDAFDADAPGPLPDAGIVHD